MTLDRMLTRWVKPGSELSAGASTSPILLITSAIQVLIVFKMKSRSFEVRVPASTANLGSGFDCCALALQLHLTVRATALPYTEELCRVETTGPTPECVEGLAQDQTNLIYLAMKFVADEEGFSLPPVHLAVVNEIPLASGLGSSGAAIVAGLKLASAISSREISNDLLLRYATKIEGHADNVAAALLGGWVIHCINEDGSVHAIKKDWPSDLKITVVTPTYTLETKRARVVLPETVSRADAVYNMQRQALFSAAIENRAYELIWEGMGDRLHQPYRRSLVPGLSEALATSRAGGLLGIALSGAGPSVLLLTKDQDSEMAHSIANRFHTHGIATTVRFLSVDHDGANICVSSSGRRYAGESVRL